VLLTQACAVETREGVQNSLGWPEGILSPPFALVAFEATIVTDEKDDLDGSAALAAVTVILAGEGIAEGAV
jgi:hypothetical protein